jgi:hypothetical protein
MSGLRRTLRGLAVLFGTLGLLAFAQFEADVRRLAAFAAEADSGRAGISSERLVRDVAYARAHIRRLRLADLHSGPVRLYYRLNPMHPGPGDVLRWGADYRGACGSTARVVHAMLEAQHIRTRVLLLTDARERSLHTVLESHVDGRWVVLDPLYGIVFHRRDGALATRADLLADPAFFHAQVDTVQGYDARYTYERATLFNWHKVPVVLPLLRAMLTRVMGSERVAAIERPDLWMWPQAAAALVCAVAALACVWMARRV